MIVNRQNKVRIESRAILEFVGNVKKGLRLGQRDFNVCFVNDREMARLNATYRGTAKPTDVLSFPWQDTAEGPVKKSGVGDRRRAAKRRRIETANFEPGGQFAETANFLGDIVISTETAQRNARGEGHSTANEIRWLILHGVLHLLGYDHAAGRGEMTGLELSLRVKLGI